MKIEPDQDDACEFIAEVQVLAQGLLLTYAPPVVIVIKIKNWFGARWLNFSGKALGALGIWKTRLTIPPFVSEPSYVSAGVCWSLIRESRPLGADPHSH